MKIVVGLGNPGKEYEDTRHNAGFNLVDEIAQDHNEKFKTEKKLKAEICQINQIGEIGNILLVKPQTFMNSSGEAVAKILRYYDIKILDNLYIVHDDLDIPLGEYKIQFGRSAAGHHGVESVINALGTKDFWRGRIGINTEGFKSLKVQGFKPEQYVLQKFPKREKMIIDEVNKKIIKELLNALS